MSSKRKAKKASPVKLALGAAVSLGALIGWGQAFGWDSLWASALRPLLRMAGFVSLGLLIGQLLEATGYAARVGVLVRPLIRQAHLPAQSGTSFLAAFVSGITANSLLYTAWEEGSINRRELILSNLLNASLPSYLLHLPTTLFIVAPLVGSAGLAYLALTLAAALLRLVAVALVGRALQPQACHECRFEIGPKLAWPELLAETFKKFKTRLIRMLLLIIPIYLAVSLAARLGFFTWLKEAVAAQISSTILPIEAMSVVIFALMAEFTSGFAAAGALLEAGELGFREVVIALLIGAMASAPIRALRHQLAHYMAIFNPRLGISLMVIGQSSRVLSLLIVTVLFGLLY